MEKTRRTTIMLLVGWMAVGLLAPPAQAAELSPETVVAFDHYIQVTEMRMDDDLRDDHFLYIDRLPADRRVEIDAQISRGEFYIEQLHTLENGRPIRVPSGLIHHWIGVAFIPRATFSQALNVLQDYDKYQQIYKPDVRQSKQLGRDGNIRKMYLQLYKKSLVSVVLNANLDADYRQLSSTRGEFRSHSTRIAEVRGPGEPDEHELAVGKDHGYLWRLDSYWRVEEKDGGVYLQVESVALSRTIPAAIAWLVNPTVRKLSKSVIANLLAATRKAVTNKSALAAQFCGDWGADLGTAPTFLKNDCP